MHWQANDSTRWVHSIIHLYTFASTTPKVNSELAKVNNTRRYTYFLYMIPGSNGRNYFLWPRTDPICVWRSISAYYIIDLLHCPEDNYFGWMRTHYSLLVMVHIWLKCITTKLKYLNRLNWVYLKFILKAREMFSVARVQSLAVVSFQHTHIFPLKNFTFSWNLQRRSYPHSKRASWIATFRRREIIPLGLLGCIVFSNRH